MCYKKPGPRCSNCTSVKLNRLKAWKQRLPESPGIDEKIAAAQDEYDHTKRGIKELRAAGDTEKAEQYQAEYDVAVEAYKETNGGVTTPISQQKPSAPVVDATEVKRIREEFASLYEQAGGTPEKPLYHDTALSDAEIAVEAKLVELGSKVEELSVQCGAPTREEWVALAKAELARTNEINERLKEAEAIRRASFAELSEKKALGESHADYVEASEAYEQNVKTHKSIAAEKKDLTTSGSPEYQEMISRRAAGYKAALVASGVTFAAENAFTVESSDKEVKDVVCTASSFFPQQWVDASNEHNRPLIVKYVAGVRAGYSPIKRTVTLGDDDLSTAVHELTHRVEETNPQVGNLERLFLYRRAGFLDYQNKVTRKKPKPVTVVQGKSEWGYARAGFPDQYVGKVYDYQNHLTAAQRKTFDLRGNSSYELMSMGTEMVFFGKLGGGEGVGEHGLGQTHKEDQDYKNFVLGVLATTGMERKS